MSSKMIHLVCSSGGVKCFSYIGAVRRLYESNISIASISACSMGTVIGALIASGNDLETLEKKILNFDFSVLNTQKPFALLYLFKNPFATHRVPDYEKIMIDLLGKDITLAEMKIPFSALALDIRQRRFLVYSSESHPTMKISEVIKIATSVPFMYPPYELDERLLVDAAIASESPVWMAVNRKGKYPIVVLKVNKEIDTSYKRNFASYLTHLISVSAESHDYFASSQIDRNIDIDVNCENIRYNNFNLSKDQIQTLIYQGKAAAEQQLKEFNFNFDHILEFTTEITIEEIKEISSGGNKSEKAAKDAAKEASNMITGFKNEILNRDQVFVSYSHEDREWLDKLNIALSPLERFAGIKAWNDSLILPGNEWNTEITKALSSTKVAVFLVSHNFLHSKFIQDHEMEYFLEVNKTQNGKILWIAISSSNYVVTPLKGIQCANDPEKPLDSLSEAEQNAEITRICNYIVDFMK